MKYGMMFMSKGFGGDEIVEREEVGTREWAAGSWRFGFMLWKVGDFGGYLQGRWKGGCE